MQKTLQTQPQQHSLAPELQNPVSAQPISQEPADRMPSLISAGNVETNNASKTIQQPISTKIFEQKLNQATELKNSGNAFFKDRNYVDAIKQYSNALKLLDPSYFYGATEVQCRKMAQLSSNLLCNMGYCYFNSHDMERADLFLSEAIVINPKYTKALHKRALSRYELKKYEEALEDIKLAFSLDKSNQEIYSAYSKILQKYNQQLKKGNQQMKEISSKIFGKDTQKSSATKKQGQPAEDQTKQGSRQSWGSFWSLLGAAVFIGYEIYRAVKH